MEEPRECEDCKTVVLTKRYPNTYNRMGTRYIPNEQFGCQVGRSIKYLGELASYCKNHSKAKVNT